MRSITTGINKKALILISLSLIVYLLYIRFLLIFSYSIDLDGAEFTFIGFTQQLLRGYPLYSNPLEFPFLPVMYTPLYPYFLYYLSRLIGFTVDSDPHNFFVMARSLSFLFTFLNVFIIYRLFKRLNFSYTYFFAAIPFYLLLITGHFYVARPDALKITFFSLFLLTTLEYLFFKSRFFYLPLSVLSGLTCVFLKQDAVIYIYLILTIACILLRNQRTFFLLTCFTGGLLVMTGVCYLLFGDQFFVSTILFNFQITTNIFKTFNLWTALFSVGRTFPLALVTIYSCNQAIKNSYPKRIEVFIPLAAVILYAISHLLMFRAGAYLNYTFESVLLIILSVILAIRSNEGFIIARMKPFSALCLLYAVMLFASNIIIHSYSYDRDQENRNIKNHQNALWEKEEITKIIGNDLVFFANPRYAIYYPKANFICGYEMHFDRLVEMLHGIKSSSRLLLVSTEKYDAYFTEGKVKYIIAENSIQSKNGIEKYHPNYNLIESFQNLVVYQTSETDDGNFTE